MSEARGVLLPAYVLVDESASMGPYVHDLSAGLVSLCEELRAAPVLAAKLRLAVLGFSDDVRVHLAVADMRQETSRPRVTVRGSTNYGAAFSDLAGRIPTDVRFLRDQGYEVHRPVVFARQGADLGKVISEFFDALTASLIASGHALDSDHPQLVVTRPEGFSIALDEGTP